MFVCKRRFALTSSPAPALPTFLPCLPALPTCLPCLPCPPCLPALPGFHAQAHHQRAPTVSFAVDDSAAVTSTSTRSRGRTRTGGSGEEESLPLPTRGRRLRVLAKKVQSVRVLTGLTAFTAMADRGVGPDLDVPRVRRHSADGRGRDRAGQDGRESGWQLKLCVPGGGCACSAATRWLACV